MSHYQRNEIRLSESKVKKCLSKKGIYNLKDFILHYAPEDLVRKIWTSKPISQKQAKMFAIYFGLGDITKFIAGDRRKKATRLSSRKIKSLLANQGVLTLKDFEIRYQQIKGDKDGSEDGTPRKVWNDCPIARNKAKEMASYFGFDNEFALHSDTDSAWERLVYQSKYQQEFMRFHAKDPGQLGLFILEDCGEKPSETIEQYKLHIKWHLTLEGKKDDYYFIILRSDDSQFEILAPIKGENCAYINLGQPLRYPQGKGRIAFDPKAGIGFRELIAIRTSGFSLIEPRSNQTGKTLGLEGLNSLANELLLDKSLAGRFSVCTHSFKLIE